MKHLLLSLATLFANIYLHSQELELVKDLNPGTNSTTFDYSFSFKGMLYSEAVFNGQRRMIMSDGTDEGTTVIEINNFEIEEYTDQYLIFNETLYVCVENVAGQELIFESDGETISVIDTSNISFFDSPRNLASFNGEIYFSADYRDESFSRIDQSLFKYDGSTITKVKDIESGSSFATRSKLANSQYLFFSGNDGTSGNELWRSDGTEAGTVLVKDIRAGFSWSLNTFLDHAIVYNDIIYFVANDGTHGDELWRSDGTESGTYMVKDIAPFFNGFKDSDPRNFIIYNNELYFFAKSRGTTSGIHSIYDLWKTDGTEAGTVKIPNNETIINSIPLNDMEILGGNLYYLSQEKLWKYDGISTQIIANADPGFNTPYHQLAVLNNEIYFIDSNLDLYKTDSSTGTINITNGEFNNVYDVHSAGNRIFVVANTNTTGNELYSFSNGNTLNLDDFSQDDFALQFFKNQLHFKNSNTNKIEGQIYDSLGREILKLIINLIIM